MKRLVDPFNFTKFDRTVPELEAMLLFSIMVANKRADQTYPKLERFLDWGPKGTPFEKVRELNRRGDLTRILRRVKAGQYNRIARAFRDVVKLDPRTCTVADLEACHGIGPKTARMYLLHSRPKQRLAVLDTHILAFLRDAGIEGVPKSTPPSGRLYSRLEGMFLALCDRLGLEPATLDLRVWNERTRSHVAA